MNRQAFIAFLVANMASVVTQIKTDGNKDQFGISGNVTQSAVKAWMNNANTSDEALQTLAEAHGYTEDSQPVASAPSLAGIKSSNITVDVAAGGTEDVPCYMLTVKKWDTARSESRGTGKVTYTPVLKCDIGGKTLSIYHQLFREKSVRDAIAVGSEVAVRQESVETINGVGRNNQPYITYRGAILEADVPAMAEARMNLTDREIALAGMSKEAQQIVNGTSAQNEANAFFAQFGK
jgi:hypothetical protein